MFVQGGLKEYEIVDLDDVTGRLAALGPYSITKAWRARYFHAALNWQSHDFRIASSTRYAEFPVFKNLRPPTLHASFHVRLAIPSLAIRARKDGLREVDDQLQPNGECHALRPSIQHHATYRSYFGREETVHDSDCAVLSH